MFVRWQSIKNGKEASVETGQNPAGCAGEGEQREGNTVEDKMMIDFTKFKFYDENTRRRCAWKGRGG